MAETISNNKRIAKNTAFLYVRMLLIIFIGLYTSRMILHALGATDFGIFNVVGGLVSLFAVINTTLASGTQRFVTFAIGRHDKSMLEKVFSIAFLFHSIIALFVIFLVETVGLWFLYSKMEIPQERINAAFWILQFSAISCGISITQVPYTACIISHEKMGVFAYLSIFDALIKLIIVFSVLYFRGDKLILYGFLWMCSSIVSVGINRVYCCRNFDECHFKYIRDNFLEKEMLAFSGWNFFGILAGALNGQGFNILLNLFFGPIINAANAICSQVNSTIMGFVNNFQIASNPQITKLYASGNQDEMYRLMENTAKFSAFILLYLMIPIIIKIDFILDIWLGHNIPQYTDVFIQIILIQNLIMTITNPLIVGFNATGKLKLPALCNGTVLLLILPISYVLLKIGLTPPQVLLVNVFPWLFRLFFTIFYDRYLLGNCGLIFLKNVVLKVLVIFSLSAIISYYAGTLFSTYWISMMSVLMTSTISLSVLVYCYGVNKEIRKVLIKQFVLFVNKLK